MFRYTCLPLAKSVRSSGWQGEIPRSRQDVRRIGFVNKYVHRKLHYFDTLWPDLTQS